MITDLIDTGASVYGIYEFSEAIGFCVMREYKDILYLAYLAVRSDSRGRGIGTATVTELANSFYDKQIVVEYEAPDGSVDHGLTAVKRRNFYRRCGFRQTGYFTFYDDTEFEIGCAGEEFDIDMFNEFVDDLSKIINDHIPHAYKKEG